MSEQTLASNKRPPDHTGMLLASVIMMLAGWGGLYYLVTTQIPRIGQRWMFFVLLYIAVAATVIPLLRFVNVRLTPLTRALPPSGVIVRQAVWVGLFVVTCAWLQIPRVLTIPIMGFVALAFLVIELFLRSREIPNERYE